MKYLALIYVEEALYQGFSQEEFGSMVGQYKEFSKEGFSQGKLLAGEALKPTSTATTVQVRDGKVQITDGPFAETKEQLGGFYLLNCENLDEAIKMVQGIPDIKMGCVEIRPIMEY